MTLSDDELHAMAGGLERDLHEELDELALDIERTIREWGAELDEMSEYPDRTSHRGVIEVESLL